MRYPPDILDEIRARLPVSAVVGRRVRLKKAGREWKGLSPFQAEKSPSFFVNDQKGFYHCFSSSKHGDIFTFVMETEGLSFPEAVERLAGEAGVSLPQPTERSQEDARRQRDLYDVVEAACRWFEGQLQTARGKAARDYLAGRAILPKVQAEFRMGFAPDERTALVGHLRAQGITDDQLVEAGLAVRPDDGRPIYDRFRGRLMIPIQDLKGRVVAFGGRALAPDQQPKYLNSPETPLFEKGRLVFNGHRARAAAHQAKAVVVVEGYLDAVAVSQAGLKAVVATLGTAFTEEQIATLWRFAPEPVICFDGDKAGRAAAFRAIDRIVPALKTGFSFRFAFLPAGQDPDDLVRSGGLAGLETCLDGAKQLWDVIWDREVELADVETINGQAVFERRVNDLVAQIPDGALRHRYQLTAKIQISDFFWQRLRKGRDARRGEPASLPIPVPAEIIAGKPGEFRQLERVFLGMCVHYPDLFEKKREEVARLNFRGVSQGVLSYDFVSDLLRIVTTYDEVECRNFYDWMDDIFFETLEFVHGRAKFQGEELLAPWGCHLFARFPILQHVVPEDFVEKCFTVIYEILWLRDLGDQVAEAQKVAAELETEQAYEQFVELKRTLQTEWERVRHDEFELADQAPAFRTARGAPVIVMADPRGMQAGFIRSVASAGSEEPVRADAVVT